MSRVGAYLCLRSGSPTPTREVDRIALDRELDPRDRALLRRIVGAVQRRRGTLRAMVRAMARGKPNPDVAAMLEIGLAQLFFFDRVPDHAAVSETVAATAETIGLPKGRYVNAVLREALRRRREGHCGDPTRDLIDAPWHLSEPFLRDPVEHPLLYVEDAYSIPASLMKRWNKRYGDERALELARTFSSEPVLSIRVVVGDPLEAKAELEAAGASPRTCEHPRILLVPPSDAEAVLATNAFGEGRLTVQGEQALRAAELVGASQGERVLDLCAAPGGKTAVLAASGADVVACDVDPIKESRVRATLERMNVADRVEFLVSDGTAALEGEEPFDAVLVDAPCSNTGVLGARPDARWRYGPARQRSLMELQDRLLAEGAELVRPSGRLVYSTCSIEPEENRQRVRQLLESAPGWELTQEVEGLPGREGPADGGYAALLHRG